jgi:putative endonuclease
MANKRHGTIYIGVTNNLILRVNEHKQDLCEGFTKRYHLHQLVYYEELTDIRTAISREKQLKNWHRDWKINLIESVNPDWNDLYDSLVL